MCIDLRTLHWPKGWALPLKRRGVWGEKTVINVSVQLWPWVQLIRSYARTREHTHTHRDAPFPTCVKDLYLQRSTFRALPHPPLEDDIHVSLILGSHYKNIPGSQYKNVLSHVCLPTFWNLKLNITQESHYSKLLLSWSNAWPRCCSGGSKVWPKILKQRSSGMPRVPWRPRTPH